MVWKGGEEANCEDFNLLRDATKKLYIVALLFAWVVLSAQGANKIKEIYNRQCNDATIYSKLNDFFHSIFYKNVPNYCGKKNLFRNIK